MKKQEILENLKSLQKVKKEIDRANKNVLSIIQYLYSKFVNDTMKKIEPIKKKAEQIIKIKARIGNLLGFIHSELGGISGIMITYTEYETWLSIKDKLELEKKKYRKKYAEGIKN